MIKFPSALDSMTPGRSSTSSHTSIVPSRKPMAETIADNLIKVTAEKLDKLPKKEADIFDFIVENTVKLFKMSSAMLKKQANS